MTCNTRTFQQNNCKRQEMTLVLCILCIYKEGHYNVYVGFYTSIGLFWVAKNVDVVPYSISFFVFGYSSWWYNARFDHAANRHFGWASTITSTIFSLMQYCSWCTFRSVTTCCTTFRIFRPITPFTVPGFRPFHNCRPFNNLVPGVRNTPWRYDARFDHAANRHFGWSSTLTSTIFSLVHYCSWCTFCSFTTWCTTFGIFRPISPFTVPGFRPFHNCRPWGRPGPGSTSIGNGYWSQEEGQNQCNKHILSFFLNRSLLSTFVVS